MLAEEILETDFKGFLYHPNLASFDIDLENGLKQTKEKFQPTLNGELKSSSLDRYHILSSFLRQKPYAFSLSADKSRQIENREFFERQIINSTTYAGNFGLKNKFIPVFFSFNNNSSTIDRETRPSQDFKDDTISLNLNNESKILGQTRFDFSRDEFSRSESGLPDQNGTSNDLSLFNQKYLSRDNKKQLNSYLRSYHLSGTRASDILNINERLDIEHAKNLNTSYNYSFSDTSSGGSDTKDNKINAILRHKLYESLNSSFNIYYFNSKASDFSQDNYGFSASEDYVKKLGKIGKLNLGLGLRYDQQDRKAPGGIISIIDEPQTLTTGITTFLNNPRVDAATVVVTNSTGTITYTLNVDYLLSAAGDNTQIQRVATGAISNGQQVLVDYQAKSSPSFKFNTLGEDFRFRLDFLNGLIGIFYRVNKETHPNVSGQENAILQTLTDTVFGLDFHYKNLEAGIEDEDYNSSLSPYKQLRLRQSVLFNPDQKSTLTFESSQTKVILVNTSQSQKFFDFLARYSRRLTWYSRFNAEGGFRWQEGTGINLDDYTTRLNYEINLGKFLMSVEYDFKHQIYLGDTLLNHFFVTKIKRTF